MANIRHNRPITINTKCCITCRHSASINSDFEYMKCEYPNIKDILKQELARFNTEKQAIVFRDGLRASETTKWNNNGVPFRIFWAIKTE